MKSFFVILFSVLYWSDLFAAACCSAGGTASPIIMEQNLLELRLSTSRSFVVAERFETKRTLFWDTERSQVTTTLTPSIGYRLSDDWQVGLAMDWIAKSYTFEGGSSEREQRIGDTRLMVAYELLYPGPPFTLRPQAFVSLEHSLLTGRGLEKSRLNGLTDVSGSDQASATLGLHLFKKLNYIRWSLEARNAYFHVRTIEESRLRQRFEHTVSLSAMSLRLSDKLNIGSSLTGIFRQGRRPVDQPNQPSEQLFEASIFGVLMLSDRTNINLSYVDQTLLGPVKNTTLSRRFGLSYSMAIER